MDILKYISGYPKLFCDILNSFLDIQKQFMSLFRGNVRAASLQVCKSMSLPVANFQDHIILKSESPAGDASGTLSKPWNIIICKLW